MAVTLDDFKSAFTVKAAPDLLSERDEQVAAALRDFQKIVGTATIDPAATTEFGQQLVGLVQRYDKVRKSSRPATELLTELDEIRRQAQTRVSEVAKSALDWARRQSSNAGEPQYATGLDIPGEPKYATGLEIKDEPKYATGVDFPEGPAAAAPADQREGMPAPFDIGASVGKGGKNHEEDVRAVQVALNRRNNAGLSVDGLCGPKLIKAIIEFQKALGQSRPDGRVDPGRGTARALAGSGKIGPPPKPPAPIAPPELGVPKLETAPAVWHGTRHILDHNIKELKRSINQEYANEHPQLLKAIDENVKKVDVILEKLDLRLAQTLERAAAAKNDADRAAELQNAQGILKDYIRYVKDETLIGHIDANPFGVDTKVGKVITDSLKHMAKSIG